MSTLPSLLVIGTGGTIAGAGASPELSTRYQAAQVPVQAVASAVPGLEARASLRFAQPVQKASYEIDSADWQAIRAAVLAGLADPALAGVVITHGTDTLEETAWFLQTVLAPRKPIVMTCAMRPSTAASPDGPQNLADALAVARTPGAQGVVMVASGTVHGARDVQKVHPYRVDAFSSGEAGPLGHMREGTLAPVRDWPSPRGLGGWSAWQRRLGTGAAWPWVELVTGHAGADERSIQALVDAGVRGLIVAGSGNGSVHEAWLAPLAAARKRGVRVWRATRCREGQVVPAAGTEQSASWDAVTDLVPVKARVALLLELLRKPAPAARAR